MAKRPSPLAVAVRAYPARVGKSGGRVFQRPTTMFVFDTETSLDPSQRLLFGSYRFFDGEELLEETLFYADDLPKRQLQILQQYVTSQRATAPRNAPPLRLLTVGEFRDRLYVAMYKARSLIVGFNLPFDFSRVAIDVLKAGAPRDGGFSLGFWSYEDDAGRTRPDRYRPRLTVKHIDSKRALISLTGRRKPDPADRIPDDSEAGEPEQGFVIRGHFLDLRTLAFALTNRTHSLKSACEDFGVVHGKETAARHGLVTQSYIRYNRRDVRATAELAVKLLEEFDRHHLDLPATKAYSPASLGKACLRAMGINPILERQPDFSRTYLGYAQSAFYGGRTSAHIRKVPVPVVYTDFLAMYPTVNALMGLWRIVTAEHVRVIEHCESEIRDLLRRITPDALFDPRTWPQLTAFVRIEPLGDLLPCRAQYSEVSRDWQVGLNIVSADGPDKALWYALPDVVASVLRTGHTPEIVDAFRIEPVGPLPSLRPLRLRGTVLVDPARGDFFRTVVEERARLKRQPTEDSARLREFLKVLANATAYGINAEMNRDDRPSLTDVTCYGIDPEPFTCSVRHPEDPGPFCFPVLASLITAGARQMLALLESEVTKRGGTYAMEDTDSMAIVATDHGGLMPCPGGPRRLPDGREAIAGLSWADVDAIADRFESLNPYDRAVVPGSILKVEADNWTLRGKRRQVWCLAISAKRYALFEFDRRGRPVLLRRGSNNAEDRWSEHGLGHLLNPTNPEGDDRAWIAQAWLDMIHRALGRRATAGAVADVPAVGRFAVTSPTLWTPFAALNKGRPYADTIKPFNFLMTCFVRPFGHPPGTDIERFHLIAPYDPDPRRWLSANWIDLYTGRQYRITTAPVAAGRNVVCVQTYPDVLRAYEHHPEAKCADSTGRVCRKTSVGLLQPRRVMIDMIRYIGKESNELEEVDAGLVDSPDRVYLEYGDRRRDEWATRIQPALRRVPLATLGGLTGLSRRTLIDARTGKRRPHPDNRTSIVAALKRLRLV